MITTIPPQLISYIAPGAPATRRPARGDEPFLRPEVGFTPKWYHQALGIDFGERWHTEPERRLAGLAAMARELRRRFPGTNIGWVGDPSHPSDLLTGTFGGGVVAGIYGLPLVYARDNWPAVAPRYLSDEQADRLAPPDLNRNPFWEALLGQCDWIARETGRLEGYLNWQGVLNNAYRLRGQAIFEDLALEPERARHVFACVTETMLEGARRLYARQRQRGFEVRHFTISNCLVNMVSPGHYRDIILPYDRKLGEPFPVLGVHNCAWRVDPYLEHYATLPRVGYLDMGLDSDFGWARDLFPHARRAVMYRPTDLARKSPPEIQADLARIARDLGPADVVLADIEADTPDQRVQDVMRWCEELGR